MVNDGFAFSGSSSVPALRINRCGRASDMLVTGVPHCSQNRRCILLPLSATLSKSRDSPVIVIPAEGKQTLTAAFPAAMNWQTRHQQRRVVIGAASVS